MDAYELDFPGLSPWAVSLALVEEFTKNWNAEVQEYDVTPTGGSITIALPVDDIGFRIARRRARSQKVARILVTSRQILSDSRDVAVAAKTYLSIAREAVARRETMFSALRS